MTQDKNQTDAAQIKIFKKLITLVANSSNGVANEKTSQASLSLCQNDDALNQLADVLKTNEKHRRDMLIEEFNKSGINGKAWTNIGLVAFRAAGKMVTEEKLPYTPLSLTRALVQQANSQKLHAYNENKNLGKKDSINPMVSHSEVSPYSL